MTNVHEYVAVYGERQDETGKRDEGVSCTVLGDGTEEGVRCSVLGDGTEEGVRCSVLGFRTEDAA